MTRTVVITADGRHDLDAMGRGECPCNICVPCENCKDDAWLHGELGCAAYVLAGDGYCGCKALRVEVSAKRGIP